MAKSKKTIAETLQEMDARWRETRMIAAQRRLADAQDRLADEMMLARQKQDLPKHDGRRVTPARADINKLYPGGVSDDISTKQVENTLRFEFQKQGRKDYYSYETVRRALRRRK
jgi:hypothetical protein